jgi:dual specificity MAP kinase phosphatase
MSLFGPLADIDGLEEDGHDEKRMEKELDMMIQYNVFVMDAKEDEMRAVLPHLMVRVHGESEVGERGGRCQQRSVSEMDSSSSSSEIDIDLLDEENEAKEKEEEVKVSGATLKANTVDFSAREKEEMRELTKASEIISVSPSPPTTDSTSPSSTNRWPTAPHFDPSIGQVFLGNSNDVPVVLEDADEDGDGDLMIRGTCDPFDYTTNDPKDGLGYDICVECVDRRRFPAISHLVAAEDHLGMLERAWAEQEKQAEKNNSSDSTWKPRPRPPPNANAVIHFPFPNTPPVEEMGSLIPFIKFLEKMLQPPSPAPPSPPPPSSSATSQSPPSSASHTPTKERRWSSVSSFMPSFSPSHSRSRSATSPSIKSSSTTTTFSRPLKILIYSSDGYTESSVLALCLLMAVRGLSLPEAYLELQVAKGRSFFVYSHALGVLKKVEGRLAEERNRVGNGSANGTRKGTGIMNTRNTGTSSLGRSTVRPGSSGWGGTGFKGNVGGPRPSASMTIPTPTPTHDYSSSTSSSYNDSTLSSFPHVSASGLDPHQMIVPSQQSTHDQQLVKSRPRAFTSPWLPSLFEDHQSWFSDPRFDGSFPSRVLQFLYLGNLYVSLSPR